jgi:hypothetical protein
VTRKGDDVADRPHRLSHILDQPTTAEPLSRELLEELAARFAPEPPPRPASSRMRQQFDIDAFVVRYLKARAPVSHEGGRKWVLEECPFNPEHTAPDSAILEQADGSLGFKCFHNSCASYGWKELRARFDPPVRRLYERPPRPDPEPEPQDDAGEETPDPESLGLPAFPETAWRGPFQDYRAAMEGTTEACDAAHFATLWTATAAILGRNVEMHAGDVVYPNVYLANFGETGDKKTTAQRRIAACNLFEHWPHIRLVRGVGSTEGLADALADSETGVYLFQWEEFATFLSHARWKESTLFEFITECFDCPSEWAKQYRKKPIRLETPTPSILTATTAEWFWKHAKAEDFFGGFGNRFLFFTGARKPPLPNPNIVDDEAIARIKQHLKTVTSNSRCRATWTTNAKKTWDAFYVRFESAETSSLLRAATKRAHVYVRKLAMTYASIEQTLPHIDEDHLQAAIAVVEYSVACTERLLDLQAVSSKPLGELEQIFLKWIAKHEGERVRRMQQLMWTYCGDSETFNRVLRNLATADRIEIRDRRVFLST